MVTIAYSPAFRRKIKKIRDSKTNERLKHQIIKIVNNPQNRKANEVLQEKYTGSLHPPVPVVILLRCTGEPPGIFLPVS